MEGRLVSEAFVDGTMERRPPRRSAEAGAPMVAASAGELDEEAETEILKRLQALGYVE